MSWNIGIQPSPHEAPMVSSLLAYKKWTILFTNAPIKITNSKNFHQKSNYVDCCFSIITLHNHAQIIRKVAFWNAIYNANYFKQTDKWKCTLKKKMHNSLKILTKYQKVSNLN